MGCREVRGYRWVGAGRWGTESASESCLHRSPDYCWKASVRVEAQGLLPGLNKKAHESTHYSVRRTAGTQQKSGTIK